MTSEQQASLVRVADREQLERAGRLVVRAGGKQIALFAHGGVIHACNNRCPHEGYPLSEGSLADGCVLTCNWHNWKFDLTDGSNLLGGDRLRTYPVEVRGDDIYLDITDPPATLRIERALVGLVDAMPKHEYDRIAREVARLVKAGGDPLDAVRTALAFAHDRLEFGATHAQAAAADWLTLRATEADDKASRLAPIAEIVGHLAWDSQREPRYPFATTTARYRPAALIEAIEAEDEEAAVAQIRGALTAGLGFAELEEVLTRAALAHYQDFGHSLIYVAKTGQLLEHLGPAAVEPALLGLTRSLIHATREDLIPEFRHYHTARAAWDGRGSDAVCAEDFAGLGIDSALDRTVAASADIAALYDALLGAAASALLHYDTAHQERVTGPVSRNVGWLDFTHAITFANAVRRQCTKFPALWPDGLLQIACFLGRNAAFTDPDLDTGPWQVDDPVAWLAGRRRALFDHGTFEYIVACHHVKLVMAVTDEVTHAPAAAWVAPLTAAVNRFVHSYMKRKHTLRTARQAMDFVARED